VGEGAAEARRRLWQDSLGYLMLVDDGKRPVGWIASAALPREGPLTADLAVAASPLLDRRTTLKDALSMLLDADVQAGLVVDRTGALLGMVTADSIAEYMRDTRAETDGDPTADSPRPNEPEPGEEPGPAPEPQPAA
jgi:osmoprotectant transport system ATP-binding protein